MRRFYAGIRYVLRQITGDSMLLAIFFAPLLLAAVIRIGVPMLESVLVSYGAGTKVLTPYYSLFDLLLAVIAPILFCLSFAMILLEEIDDKVARYFMVTPLGKNGYLFSRIGVPAFISLTMTSLLLTLFHLGEIEPMQILATSILGTLLGMIEALLIVTLSTNKLEGMAVAKLASVLTLGGLVPYVTAVGRDYLFAVLPAWWLGEYTRSGGFNCLLGGVVVSAIWILLLADKFNRKVSK